MSDPVSRAMIAAITSGLSVVGQAVAAWKAHEAAEIAPLDASHTKQLKGEIARLRQIVADMKDK